VDITVRAAEARDADAIAAIYNQGIEERQATFQTRPHSAEDFVERIEGERPFLVAEANGELAGWAAVLPYSDPAPYYAGVGEATMYVARTARRRGVGRRLLTELARAAESSGFYKLVGKIFTSNRPSIELITGLGYLEVGIHRRHGRLDGEWKDVLVVELLLGEAGSEIDPRGV
jgi:phosphinothricin acetyltransferase